MHDFSFFSAKCLGKSAFQESAQQYPYFGGANEFMPFSEICTKIVTNMKIWKISENGEFSRPLHFSNLTVEENFRT